MVLLLVSARQRSEYVPKRDQEIAEGGAQIDVMCRLSCHHRFGQPAVLGLPETIFVLFACDELA